MFDAPRPVSIIQIATFGCLKLQGTNLGSSSVPGGCFICWCSNLDPNSHSLVFWIWALVFREMSLIVYLRPSRAFVLDCVNRT